MKRKILSKREGSDVREEKKTAVFMSLLFVGIDNLICFILFLKLMINSIPWMLKLFKHLLNFLHYVDCIEYSIPCLLQDCNSELVIWIFWS